MAEPNLASQYSASFGNPFTGQQAAVAGGIRIDSSGVKTFAKEIKDATKVVAQLRDTVKSFDKMTPSVDKLFGSIAKHLTNIRRLQSGPGSLASVLGNPMTGATATSNGGGFTFSGSRGGGGGGVSYADAFGNPMTGTQASSNGGGFSFGGGGGGRTPGLLMPPSPGGRPGWSNLHKAGAVAAAVGGVGIAAARRYTNQTIDATRQKDYLAWTAGAASGVSYTQAYNTLFTQGGIIGGALNDTDRITGIETLMSASGGGGINSPIFRQRAAEAQRIAQLNPVMGLTGSARAIQQLNNPFAVNRLAARGISVRGNTTEQTMRDILNMMGPGATDASTLGGALRERSDPFSQNAVLKNLRAHLGEDSQELIDAILHQGLREAQNGGRPLSAAQRKGLAGETLIGREQQRDEALMRLRDTFDAEFIDVLTKWADRMKRLAMSFDRFATDHPGMVKALASLTGAAAIAGGVLAPFAGAIGGLITVLNRIPGVNIPGTRTRPPTPGGGDGGPGWLRRQGSRARGWGSGLAGLARGAMGGLTSLPGLIPIPGSILRNDEISPGSAEMADGYGSEIGAPAHSDAATSGRGPGTIGSLKQLLAGLPHRITSTVRPGSKTRSGGLSFHATGHALDIAGPRPGDHKAMLRINHALAKYGKGLKELIYGGPGGINLRNGKPHQYSPQVLRDHLDHVHVAATEDSLSQIGAAAATGPGGTKSAAESAREVNIVGAMGSSILGLANAIGSISEADLIASALSGGGVRGFSGAGGRAATGAGRDDVVSGGNISKFLRGLRQVESGGNYKAQNKRTSASGAYQYIDRTWGKYKGYARAYMAPPEVQDERAQRDIAAAWAKYKDWRAVAVHHMYPAWADNPEKWHQRAAPGNPTLNDYWKKVLSAGGISFGSSREAGDGDGGIAAASVSSGGSGGVMLSAPTGGGLGGGGIVVNKMELTVRIDKASDAEAERFVNKVVKMLDGKQREISLGAV